MWNNRQSQLLLVRLSRGGMRRLVIPIPLFVLDLTLAAFSDLICLGDSLVPQWRRKAGWFNRSSYGGSYGGSSGKGRISAGELLESGLHLFRELRKYGRWRMVEVQSDQVRVSIDFY